ncbi:MAG: class I SAM-dependent methyltransferase, partial [Bryobacteraceae bacterium]
MPSLADQARLDLPERCLHWVKAALRFKLPPSRVLELGSAHGGFVALMRWAGFEATGLDLSPTLVQFGRDTFGVETLLGPVEEQDIPHSSLDMIAAMDVAEHLPDPMGTIEHCLTLLEDDGVLLIQTPRYVEGRTLDQMTSESDPFLHQLKPEQHLFLFSETSIGQLLARVGFRKVEFLPAIFAHYDMFLVAARRRLRHHTSSEIRDQLAATPSARMIGALLDKDDDLEQTIQRITKCEADRAARLVAIEEQGRRLDAIEAERNRLVAELRDLRQHFEASESDRAARLVAIEEQGQRLG